MICVFTVQYVWFILKSILYLVHWLSNNYLSLLSWVILAHMLWCSFCSWANEIKKIKNHSIAKQISIPKRTIILLWLSLWIPSEGHTQSTRPALIAVWEQMKFGSVEANDAIERRLTGAHGVFGTDISILVFPVLILVILDWNDMRKERMIWKYFWHL